ncbi:alpha/beta fold hydrolase [Lentzea sp. NPDC092896]|uniref:alpha/beta fold hydrolase n=1 Tax=Lentzea sp. NPDC092896 TaxID=3364127 RepID=UPI00382EB799
MRSEHGVVYREVLGFRPLELDLHLPDDPVATVVYLHGGGWRRGSRRHPVVPDFFERLVAEGFAVTAVDYRLSGEATFPAPLEDVLVALDHLRRPVFLLGESAGAHLALLAALSSAKGVLGVVAWFPPTDLLAMPGGPDSREAGLLGSAPDEVPDLARAASPLTHVHAAAPPVLLMHGDADDLVPLEQSIRMADALRTAGAPVELEIVPGARHMWIDADTESVVDRSVAFLRSVMRSA